LTRADVVAVAVVTTVIIVIVAVGVAIGSQRRRTGGCAPGCTAPGAAADGRACDRTAGYRAISVSTSGNVISATPHADSAAVEPSGTHTAATTAGERLIRNQACGDQNERCQSSENISKHGTPPQVLFLIVVEIATVLDRWGAGSRRWKTSLPRRPETNSS
jgi:hypothetical protein